MSALPSGSLQAVPESAWTQFHGWILAGIVLLLLQAALIVGLLAERRRRRASQHALGERLRLHELVTGISTAFANATADTVEQQIDASLERVGRAVDAEDCALWTWRSPDAASQLVARWLARPGALPIASVLDDAILSWARPRLGRRDEVEVDDVADVVPAASSAHDEPRPAMLLLPLQVDGTAIGALGIRYAQARAWTTETRSDLRTIGEILATAVVRRRTDTSIRTQLTALAHIDRQSGLGEVATAIAHELNQPLAAILANTEVALRLLDAPAPRVDEIRDIVADVIADDERAAGIIRTLRATLRAPLTTGTSIDVNAIVAEVARLVAHDPRLSGNVVQLTLAPGAPDVAMDATQLKQVLLNLVVNAVEAMAGRSPAVPVRVRTSAGQDGVLVEVRDGGLGVPADVMQRLFEPFFTTKPDGLGAGLSISRAIVESAGGHISAANATGGGAVFRVWLPAARRTATS